MMAPRRWGLAVGRLVLGLALLTAVPDVAFADAEDVEAYRQARERFRARMAELNDDTRAFVLLRETELIDETTRAFDGRIALLEEQEREQRRIVVEQFESFLAAYPDSSYASHVRFRLADLAFEDATDRWTTASEAYYAKLDDPEATFEELETMGDPPVRDLARPLALYREIIEQNAGLDPKERYERLDGTYLMMGFVHMDENNAQYDREAARTALENLIAETSESALVDRAHLFIGNFLFEDNEFDAAIARFEDVYAQGDASKYFVEALYQLAWARYKLNYFDEALALFTELLDGSEEQFAQSGQESSFAPDAKRFLAFSFADIAYDRDVDALEVADDYFADVGARPYEREVYEHLADVLIRYTRPIEAVQVYEKLQTDPRWYAEANNPEHQKALIALYQTSVARDLSQAGAARLAFIERYGEGTDWWRENRNNPDALDVARSFLESSLLDVAIEYRVRAQETGMPADFAVAADKYRIYLDQFPMSDDYYKQQWYLADSLKLAGDHPGSLREFESLHASAKYHPYGDAVLYSLMDVRYQEMVSAGHLPGEPPSAPSVERTVAPMGQNIDVFALTSDRADFISSADMVVAHTFSAPTESDLPDYQEAVAERRPSLMYLSGQILFHHNRFDEARPRLEAVIDEYPHTTEANYAAGLLVDSYLAEGDLAQVRAYTKRFAVQPPGPPSEVDLDRFGDLLEGTTFKLATEQAEGGDELGAVDAFLAFRQEFPNSEFSADALYSAAFYAQRAGNVTRSNELYEQFVAEYPDEDRSKGLLFRIAANYESAFQLSKAVGFYEQLLQHPNAGQGERADAQYNKSFLLIGMGDYRGAARGFESYERNYPDQEDGEEVLWLAGEAWEQVGPREAITFYTDYKRRYPDANADHVLQAESRIYELREQIGTGPRGLAEQREAIVSAFDRFVANGVEIGAAGHHAAARAAYPDLAAAYDDFADDTLSGNEDRDAALLNDEKPAELKELEASVRSFVGRYQDFEFNSGALLLQAKAALAYADLGLSIQCPPALSEEDCWLFEDILLEQVFPQYYEVEDVGIQRLQALVEGAKGQKRHSAFVDEALALLNERRPADHPAVKEEMRGDAEAHAPIVIVPVSSGEEP